MKHHHLLTRVLRRWGLVTAWAVCMVAWAAGPASPPPAPDTRSMIEALMAPPIESEGRARNLLVRQKPEVAAPGSAAASSAGASATAATSPPPPGGGMAAGVPQAPAPGAAPALVTGPPSGVGAGTSAGAAAGAGAVPVPGASPSAPSLSLAIQFETNSAQVRPESGPVLGNLVAALLSPELKARRFAIEGHTDASGLAARNLALSQARADEVRLFLVALGVHPSRLKAVGKGSSELANPRDPRAAENRRVRVVGIE